MAMAIAMVASAARADVIDQTDVIAPAMPDWTDGLTYDQFDPAGGTLTGVKLSLTGTLTADLKIENREASAATVNASANGSVTAYRPDNAYLTGVSMGVGKSETLSAYDGVTDFSGASGRTYTGLTHSATTTTGGTFGSGDAAVFTGTGTVSLPVAATATAHVGGAANMAGQVQSAIGASGTLSYTFDPAGSATSSPPDGGFYGSTGSTSSGGLGPFGTAFDVNSVRSETQIRSVASQTTGWSENLSFAKFNPALGTLEAIEIAVTSKLTADQKGENLTDGAATLTIKQGGGVKLRRADGTAIAGVETNLADKSHSLAAFDGNTDFGGASGFSDDDLMKVAGQTAELGSLADLALFSGADDIVLSILSESFGQVDGPGSFWFDLAAQADAMISLYYVYLPTGVASAGSFYIGSPALLPLAATLPEPSALALFGLGAFGLLARRRR